MKSLYELATAEELRQRLGALTPSRRPLWGKMDSAQMVAHCAAALEMALGDRAVPQVWAGRLLGPFFKSIYSNEKPFGRDMPTARELVAAGEHELAEERERLVTLMDRFTKGGADVCTRKPHCFFGHLTPEEWGKGMYKHLDHHLRQFGA